jgi:hypothetical protein
MDEIEERRAWAALDELRSAVEFAELAVERADELALGVAGRAAGPSLGAPPALPLGLASSAAPLDGLADLDEAVGAGASATPEDGDAADEHGDDGGDDDDDDDDALLAHMVAAQAKKARQAHVNRGGGGGGGRKGKGRR